MVVRFLNEVESRKNGSKRSVNNGSHFEEVHEEGSSKYYGKSYGSYDAVFLHPFSPLKSPELYSVEFFKTLKVLMKDDGMILTYTSTAPVRSALVEAGFHVGEGPSFGG